MTDFPALGIWMSLKNKVNLDAKLAEVEKFNAEHRWRKRGVCMTPVKYEVGFRKQQCLVNLYDNGTCLITCDGMSEDSILDLGTKLTKQLQMKSEVTT